MESLRDSNRSWKTSTFRIREREFLRWKGKGQSEKHVMRSPATATSVRTSVASERSTGARNASSDGDRRRRSDENITPKGIGKFVFFFLGFSKSAVSAKGFARSSRTQMVIWRIEQFPRGKGTTFETFCRGDQTREIFAENVFWASKRHSIDPKEYETVFLLLGGNV